MVQLKPVVGDNVDVIVEFQFHNGTIKTWNNTFLFIQVTAISIP